METVPGQCDEWSSVPWYMVHVITLQQRQVLQVKPHIHQLPFCLHITAQSVAIGWTESHTHLLGNPLRTAGEIFHRPAVVSAAQLMVPVPKYWTYWPGDIVVLSVFVIKYSKCHFNLLYVISILSLGFCLTSHFSVATIDTKQSPVNLPWITSWNCCYSILHSLDGLPYHQLAVLKYGRQSPITGISLVSHVWQ